MKIHELRETLAGKVTEMNSLIESDSEESAQRFKTLEQEARSLQEQISRSERAADFERAIDRAESINGTTAGEMDLRSYSVSKAIRESQGGRLTGIEAEANDELSHDREVRGVMVPVDVLLRHSEARAALTNSPSAGGNLVATDLASMTDRRRPALKTEAMGATVLRGLTGNLDLPRLTSSGTAHWIDEHENTARSDVAFSKVEMGPKTVSGEYELSRRMQLQSNEAIENLLRQDLGFIIAQALDAAMLRGGGDKEPIGILSNSDVQKIDGGTLDSDITAELIAALETDDVTGTRAFLTNPAVMKAARQKKDADGRVIPIAELFHGERVEISTQVPGELGDGDKNALIYGEWASLYLGYWSGVDILANPYHADVASKGGLLLHAFLDCDVVVRHPEGFRYAEIG